MQKREESSIVHGLLKKKKENTNSESEADLGEFLLIPCVSVFVFSLCTRQI